MDSSKREISYEIPPFLRVYKDGSAERLFGCEIAPAGCDPQTGVVSKDTVIIPETGVSARLYRPNTTPELPKLPLVIYFHGGGFFLSSTADPKYHNSLNKLVAEANVVLVSVNYRKAPEHPLPAAYEDSWAALEWVASHMSGGGSEDWLRGKIDFSKVYLAGDSAGANMSHHFAIRFGSNPIGDLRIRGIIMIHPYFWGEEPIGEEKIDMVRKSMVDAWWRFVCPSDKGNDDPVINPFVDGAPSLSGLACDRVVVCLAEKDILRDRGKLYYESLVKSGWNGKAEILEIEGVDHVFHIMDPTCEKAVYMVNCLARFINQE